VRRIKKTGEILSTLYHGIEKRIAAPFVYYKSVRTKVLEYDINERLQAKLVVSLNRLQNVVDERRAGGGSVGPTFVAGTLALARELGLNVTAIEEGRAKATNLRALAEEAEIQRLRVLEAAQKQAATFSESAALNTKAAKDIDRLLGMLPDDETGTQERPNQTH
jgi:hypothetical protein